MSWATQYKNPNNINIPYPGIVQDGRLFTSYSPSAIINNEIRKQNHLNNDRDYKSYLQKNASIIMSYNFKTMGEDLGTNRAVPFTFYDVNDRTIPNGYETSTPKNIYLSREQLNANQTRPMQSSINTNLKL